MTVQQVLLGAGMVALILLGIIFTWQLDQLNTHLAAMEAHLSNVEKATLQLEERTRLLDRVLPHVSPN